MNNINTEEKGQEWSADYKKSQNKVWKIADGTLSIRYFLNRPVAGKHNNLVEEVPYIKFRRRKNMNFDEAAKLAILIEDFFVILTDNESGLLFQPCKLGDIVTKSTLTLLVQLERRKNTHSANVGCRIGSLKTI